MSAMLKSDVIAVFGTRTDIAKLLGVNRSAITQWPRIVPKLRQYELREKRPTIDDEILEVQRLKKRRAVRS